mmetsp:Transcript_21989/g.32679  ORF Transcript_21989/g.32679 Transcript_21989/m.32679 type:complete len:696 (-) Transcript_21989:29-2116(-)|eukprot:CAMPEP_0201555296 /NCGR_PEP_ID=MMETSP0173_2-20130828/47758_1 /ASSEMBLY_ACC=CAM_ASM_000268 /TAXON_ID=218659 /ORGANISM="Vexillifera sp., Strain DIVA3 564/2" /LENGTH=695 /DNA_ID=CAMNT_0047967013 /DNA_START=531 /DNA_END=2618 /DNA_ORIENTATION=+
MLQSKFNQKQDKWAVITDDNRLKIWNTFSAQLHEHFFSSKHLSDTYTCLAWGINTDKRKKRARQQNDLEQLGFVALGSHSGRIVCWDLRQGKIVHEFSVTTNEKKRGGKRRQDAHRKRVNDLVFDSKASRLFSCGDDGLIFEWDLQTGNMLNKFKAGKKGVGCSALALSPNDKVLLSASTTIQQWDVSSANAMGKRTAKYAGHSSQVIKLGFVSDKVFYSAAANDRFVNVWTLDTNNAASSSSNTVATRSSTTIRQPMQVLTADFPVQSLCAKSLSKSIFHIAALSQDQLAVSIWQVEQKSSHSSSSSSSNKKKQLKSSVLLTAASQQQQQQGNASQILALTFNTKHDSLLIVKSPSFKPSFHRLQYFDSAKHAFQSSDALNAKLSGDGSEQTEIEKTTNISVVQAPNYMETATNERARQKQNASVVGHNQMPSFPSSTTIALKSAQDSSTNTGAHQALIEQLSKQLVVTEQEKGVTNMTKDATPKAISLYSVLIQALNTSDKALLASCLEISDIQIIEKTVEKLPVKFVMPFLQTIVKKFESQPGRGTALIVWIKSILVQHTAYLVSAPHLAPQLSRLYQTVDSRLMVFNKLLKLSGRLDLIMAQLDKRDSLRGEQARDSEPLATYQANIDDFSDDDDDDDAFSSDWSSAPSSDGESSHDDSDGIVGHLASESDESGLDSSNSGDELLTMHDSD